MASCIALTAAYRTIGVPAREDPKAAQRRGRFRKHFVKRIALNRKKPVFSENSDYATYCYHRFQWSKPVFVLALYTGLRRTDLRLLKWTNVDLKNGVIRLVMRKTQRSVTIPIVPRLRDTFQELRRRPVLSEYVLTTPEGYPYSDSTTARYFQAAKAIAWIARRFRFHDQRHPFASTLASRGINSFTLRDLLGHTSTSTRTTERYARPSNEILTAVAEGLA